VGILREGRLVVVDSLENLRAIAVRKLEVEFAGQAPDVEQLRALPGVRDATLNSTHLTIAFEGSADPVVKAIARYEVRSLRSREDELEEIFLRHYRGGGDS
jgi:ABC-2 type transport system ATP-binding protein